MLGIGSTVTGSPGLTQPSTSQEPPATAGGTDPASTALPRTGNLAGYCTTATQSDLVQALTGKGSTAAADPALWTDLPALPLLQQSAVFAASDSLRSVLAGDHSGWMWTGPLIGLPGWPVG